MWSNSSQTWLVKRKRIVNTNTDKKIEHEPVSVYRKYKYGFNVFSMKIRNLKISSFDGACNRKAEWLLTNKTMQPRREDCCIYQILEVLLAIFLANCLINVTLHLPTVAASFRTTTITDEKTPNIQSPSASSIWSNLQSHDLGGKSAFEYNVLQQQQLRPHLGTFQSQRSQNFKIIPKPCSIGRVEGTCMFVWECIKSEGRHVGMCVDSFMFGSCCTHNYTDNIVLPQTFSYSRPTKPLKTGNEKHRPKPPNIAHKPSISGMTTIERPHGAGTLVIRPSGPHHQGALYKPQYTKLSSTNTPTDINNTAITTDPSLSWTSNTILSDMQLAASSATISSLSGSMWNTLPFHQHFSTSTTQSHQHWHITTEPNFITKTRQPIWDKPMSLHSKPIKPTKKPIMPQRPALHPHTPSSIAFLPHRPVTISTTVETLSKPTLRPLLPSSSSSSLPFSYYTKTTDVPTPSTTAKYSPEQSTPSKVSVLPTTGKTTTETLTSTVTATQNSNPTTTTLLSPQTLIPMLTTYPLITSSKPTHRPHLPPSFASSTERPSLLSSTYQSIPTASLVFSSSSEPTLNNALLPHNLSTVESNEITDSSLENIKLISAARTECGISVLARPETRIVGGKSAAFGRWPWQVSVRRTSFFGFSSTHRCGGVLVNEDWIITAGHCVDDLLLSQIRIRVGEYDFSHVQEQLPYIERGAAKKVVYPKYNFFTYEHDLALVKLEHPVAFAAHISPICLPQTNNLLIGMNATLTGWGRLSEGGPLPSVLQEVTVPIVSNEFCKTMYLSAGRQEFIPDIFICAGYETGGKDSCQGDSGGPLQVKAHDGRYFLAGIISWGIGCGEPNLPGVCTRISKFVPWIMENVAATK